MAFSNEIVAGIAQLLEDAGVGTWKPTGAYLPTDDRPIFVQELPPAPHRAIALAHYRLPNRGWTKDSIEGIQIRLRGLPGDSQTPNDDADAVEATLDGLQHVYVGGRHVSLIEMVSGAPLSQDNARRWETVRNLYLYTARPGANRED